MSIEDLKELLGTQETVLELVQLEDGVLALRGADTEKQPLVTIEFNEDVRKLLGDTTGIVAQHMIQAAIFGVIEHQAAKTQAQVVEYQPQFYS